MANQDIDIRALKEAAQLVAQSRLANGRSVADIFTLGLAGAELGLGLMQSIRQLHVMKGEITLSADLVLGLVKSHPQCEYVRLVESTEQRACYETKRKGDPKPTRYEYTLDMAKRAGLYRNGPWKDHTEAMLRARAATALARSAYPDAVANLYDPEERGGQVMTANGPIESAGVYASPVKQAPCEVCAPWMRKAVEHVSALPGLGDALSDAIHAMGIHSFEHLREHLERGRPMPKGVGKTKSLDAYNAILQWYGEEPVAAIPVTPDKEPQVPEPIEADTIADVEEGYPDDPTQPEYWQQRVAEAVAEAEDKAGAALNVSSAHAVELGYAKDSFEVLAWAEGVIAKDPARESTPAEVCRVFAHLGAAKERAKRGREAA